MRHTGGYLVEKTASKNTTRKARLWKSVAAGIGAALLSSLRAFAVTSTGTTTVTATIAADASITISSPTNLTTTGAFASFTGSTTVTFSIRTTRVGGSGSIVLQATSDFAPAGGPLVANNNLTYTCSGSPSVGSPCVGTITASTGSTTNVVTGIGADAKANGTGVTVNWTL